MTNEKVIGCFELFFPLIFADFNADHRRKNIKYHFYEQTCLAGKAGLGLNLRFFSGKLI
jgi:hypothetical protein